jgi:hypothetical protein
MPPGRKYLEWHPLSGETAVAEAHLARSESSLISMDISESDKISLNLVAKVKSAIGWRMFAKELLKTPTPKP